MPLQLSPKKLQQVGYRNEGDRQGSACGRSSSDSGGMVSIPPLTAKTHLGKLAENLKRMRENQVLCDYILVADGISMPVHKVIMAASSDYFLSMLTSSMRESREGEVELKGITACALQIIVEFAYTGILKVNMLNVEEVLAGATHLQVIDAVKLCSSFIEKTVTITNCVDALNLAELYSLESTQNVIKSYILQNFEQVAYSEQYTLIRHDQLSKFLEENSLRISSEYKLFQLVLKWINFDREEREKFVAELMKCVRLPLLSGEEIVDKVSRVELMKNNKDCLELLTEAKDYHILIAKQPLHQNESTQVRSNISSLVMCFGESLECFGIVNRQYRAILKDPLVPLYNPAVAVVDNFMYTCGGKYDNQPSNEIANARCFRYDPRFDCWYELASMNEPRQDFALVGLEGHLYAVGGQDENKVMNTMECYSIATNEWDRKCSISDPVYGHAGAVCNGKIYISGGQKFANGSSKLYMYNRADDNWEEKKSMLYPRIHHSMEGVGGKLYAIGGSINGGLIFPTLTPTIERYCPNTDQWTLCKQTANILDSGSCVYDDKIYMIMGGTFGEGNYLEYYDPNRDETKIVHMGTTTLLSGKACCILTVPPYIHSL